ncbi:MarR family winged helix-turn-helix transcriptional regulator [Vogesella sp. LIG4]|uniref:MarR family winged helix-turn-helix transcriptional regulator n=1 Tax=Vogesella sp. LIG4 TaxID=1192162 RepID=UPI0008201FC7|nr:MarR family transcriptional regulator [Vogesella sp. LIG4]SCK30097.1 transcriptional regulator, MarR family [Vogesella sp. LIG4]
MTTADSPAQDKPSGIAYLIGRLDHVLSRRMRDSLLPLGLTVQQYTTLSFLCTQGQLSNAQLAERSLISPQSANEMVKMMEGKGWIEREPDPSHGRIIQIRLTEAGKVLLYQCDAAVAQLEAVMLAELGDEERPLFHQQLRTLVRTLSAPGI